MWKLAGPRMLGWYARTPDELAMGYARKARAGLVPMLVDADGDASQYCSSLIVATWQATVGSLPGGIYDEEREKEMLSRVPMKSRRTMPTDWSLLPRFSPHWEIVGVVTKYSGKRRFDWWTPGELDGGDREGGEPAGGHEGVCAREIEL